MHETLRIVEKLRPKYVVWENVKNLLSEKHSHNFVKYLERMESLGYTNSYEVLNGKDYGIPQNRERVFVVSIYQGGWFIFPKKQQPKMKLKDFLEEDVDKKYFLSEKILQYFLNEDKVQKEKQGGFRFKPFKDINDSIAKTITTKSGQRISENFLEIKTDRNWQKVIYKKGLWVRKFTEKECWRLMGFRDEDYEKAAQVNSTSQLYKQAGNSIIVNVLMAIFECLFYEYLDEEEK